MGFKDGSYVDGGGSGRIEGSDISEPELILHRHLRRRRRIGLLLRRELLSSVLQNASRIVVEEILSVVLGQETRRLLSRLKNTFSYVLNIRDILGNVDLLRWVFENGEGSRSRGSHLRR